MKRLLLLIFPLFFLASCEDVIEFDTTLSESQLVLNAVPSCQQQLTLYFGYSRFFLDGNNNNPVTGAEVVVSVNGRDYHPDSVRHCSYYFPYTLCDDDSLSVRITAAGNTVTAHTYVPRMPQISALAAFVDSSNVFDCLVANFNISDYPNYKEYYCFTVTQRDSGCSYNEFYQRFDTIDTTYNTYFVCMGDPALTASDASASVAFGGYFYDRLLTTDKHIDGTTHNTTLMVMLLTDTTEVYPFVHQYTLNVESVTPDRYSYLQALSNATSLTQYFTEPAPVYSNVQGALGIFAGNARRTFPLHTRITGRKGY